MINVSEKVRELYKTDRIPIRKEPITKNLYIEIKETGTVISDSDMELENFTLEESICSASEIVFGSCEASFVSFAVYQTVEDLSSKTIRIWQTINGESVPFGTYTVATVTKRDGDPRWKDITAYDRMAELDKPNIDATAWFTDFWNKHPTSTVKEFRLDFFKFMGFEVLDQTLINDDLEIKKTIDPEFIKARYIAQKIGEINASFGHFTRDNKFKYIDIGSIALYPAEDLYPSEDLYPAESTEILSGDSAMLYFADESHYEDYYVRAIDSVQIKASDGSAGITVGKESKNPYIIHSNFFTFGKSEQEIKEIAQKFLNVVKYKFYIPNTTKMIGLPYLEVGDTVSVMLEQDAIETFIFQRKLSGIHALTDEITAKGNEYRKNDMDENAELMQLKAKVDNNMAETDEKLKEQEEETNEKFKGVNTEIGKLHISLEQTSDGLAAEVTRAIGEEQKLSSQIIMTAQEIRLSVSETYQSKIDAASNYAKLQSEIKLTSENITSTVSANYETKTSAEEQYANLSSQIVQSANSITSTVSANYETKSNAGNYYQSFQSQINQQANQISLKVSAGEVESLIEQKADSIRLKGGTIVIDSTYFSVTSSGYMTCTGGEIGPFSISYRGFSAGNGKVHIWDDVVETNMIYASSGKYLSIGAYGDTVSIEGTMQSYSTYSTTTTGDANVHIGSAGNFRRTSGSLRKLKRNISDIKDSSVDAHLLYGARPRQFIYKDGYLSNEDSRNGKYIPGFVVEELMEDYPIAVEYDDNGEPENWGARFFIAPMLQLIQEQHKEIEEIKEQIKNLTEKREGTTIC